MSLLLVCLCLFLSRSYSEDQVGFKLLISLPASSMITDRHVSLLLPVHSMIISQMSLISYCDYCLDLLNVWGLLASVPPPPPFFSGHDISEPVSVS